MECRPVKLPFLFLFIIYGSVAASEHDEDEARKQLMKSRIHFANVMNAKIDTVCPLLRLRELEEAGRDDLRAIDYYSGPVGKGDKDRAKQKSIKFWSSKMEDLIQPFITDPEAYQGKLVNFTYIPSDPSPGARAAGYEEAEKEINRIVKVMTSALEAEYAQKTSKRVDDLENITQDSWKRFQGGKKLFSANFNIHLWGQKAKELAASGKPWSPFLREHVERETKEFHKFIRGP